MKNYLTCASELSISSFLFSLLLYTTPILPPSLTHSLPPTHPPALPPSLPPTHPPQITDILRGYTQLLTTVAHLLPDDVHRLMEEEAHTANLSLLANRRTSTNLGLQLVVGTHSRPALCGWGQQSYNPLEKQSPRTSIRTEMHTPGTHWCISVTCCPVCKSRLQNNSWPLVIFPANF